MKILRLLNKINLSILISFFLLQNSYSTEPIDIWNIENQSIKKDDVINNELLENESSSTISIYQNQSKKKIKFKLTKKKIYFQKI